MKWYMNFTIVLLLICFIYGVPEAYSPNGGMGIGDPALLERFLSVVNMIALISSALDCIALKCSRLKHETWHVSFCVFWLNPSELCLSSVSSEEDVMQRYWEHVGQKIKVLWPQRVHVPLLPRTGQPCHSLLRVSMTGSYLLVDDHCCDVLRWCVSCSNSTS